MVFLSVIWPPAFKFKSEIVTMISESHNVTNTLDLSLSDKEFEQFVKCCYKSDKTPGNRIKQKIKAMQKYKLNLSIIYVDIPNPTMKPHTKARLMGKFYCSEMKKMKKPIREAFKNKIQNYIYDIILHTCDNVENCKTIEQMCRRANK